MITVQDCLALNELTPDEIDLIARHEHVPRIVAAELGHHLIGCPDGVPRIKRFMLEDIEDAERHGKRQRARELKQVLQGFVDSHPERGVGR